MKRNILPAITFSAASLLVHGTVISPAQAQRFGEEISVVEVEIPVHVLRDGEPVPGLTAADFEVLDNGEPREIVGFRVVDLTSADPGQQEPEGLAARGAAAPADREGRSLLVLFDLLFSRRHYLDRSLPSAKELLVQQLHPTDRVAVAYLSGSGAKLLLGFTRDRREIETSLEAIEAILDARPRRARKLLAPLMQPALPEAGVETGSTPMRKALSRLTGRFGPAAALALVSGTGSSGQGAAFATFLDGESTSFNPGSSVAASIDPVVGNLVPSTPEEIGASLAAESASGAIYILASEISRLATLLRGVPGHKQILYLSEGFGSGLLELPRVGTLVQRVLETDLFETLRGAGWTLHAIDVEGIPDPFSGPGFDAQALHFLSNETGGMLFENFNRMHQATERLLERTSLTYVLTISPGKLPADGRLHRLQVRLKNPQGRTRLFHRTGYYSPKPAVDKDDLERRMDTADLLLGDEVSEQLGARLRAGALPPVDGLIPVSVVVEVPAEGILGDRSSGKIDLEMQLYALEARGGVQDLWLRNLDLDLDEVGATITRGGLRVLGGVAIPPGEYRLRTLIRNRSTDRVSLSTTPITVSPDQGGLLPLDPVVLDRSGDWLQLAALPSGSGWAPLVALGQGSTPAVSPIEPAVAAHEGLQFLVVTPGGEEVELSARLLDARRRPVAPPEAVTFVDRRADSQRALVRHVGHAATDGLAPGGYLLEVSARDTTGSNRASRSLRFEVREGS